ncbi:type II secretion system GspH family protein [Nitrospinaceae bacterium]|nr:type II secretion system GspH family protein [Nitrospinaceae bacterium]
MQKYSTHKSKSGFTLIELLIVIAITVHRNAI